MKKIMALVLTLMVMAGLAGTASAAPSGWAPAKGKPKAKVIRLYHPCDWNKNTKLGGAVERLCFQVWKQEAYTVSDKRGNVYMEAPSGPAIVSELVIEARAEGKKRATAYFVQGLTAEAKMYKKRDK